MRDVDPDSYTEPSGARPEADASGPDGPSDDGFDVEVSESTDREAEIVSDEDEEDPVQVDASDDDVSRRRSRAGRSDEAPVRSPAAPPARTVSGGSSSLDYPLLEDDYEEEQRRSSDGRGQDGGFERADRRAAERARRPSASRPDSVDIPIEEVLETGSGRVISSVPLQIEPVSDDPHEPSGDSLESLERALGGGDSDDPERAARASGKRGSGTLEFGDLDSGGSASPEDSGGWSAAASALSGGDVPFLRRAGAALSEDKPSSARRLQTVSLSESDLEEVEESDGEPDPHAPFSADAGWSMPDMPSLEWGREGRGEGEDARSHQDGDASPAPLASTSGVTHASPVFGSETGTGPIRSEHLVGSHGHGRGAASLSGAAGRVGSHVRSLTSRDPGDSGEIIADEFVEEIEESQRSTPLAARADRAAAAPRSTLDPDSALDLAGAHAVEARPAAPRGRPARSGETGMSAAAGGPHAAQASSAPPVQGKPKPPPAPSATRAAAAAAAAAAADPSQARPRRRRGKPWFEDIFDEDYLRTLPFLTPQATQMEAQFVMDALAISAGTQVLDVGCGYGRHAMELAARGFHVVGLDSSLPLLLRGADEAQRRGLTINFVHGDMRDMAFDAQFDGAYCLFSTFGYFDDETNKKTAQNICRALKPGARCVFEVLNRDYIIAELPLRVWWEGDGCVVLEEVDFNYFSSRLMSNRSVVFDDGRQLEQEISIRSFGLHELGKLLHSAGFRVVEVSGNMITKGRFFGAQSRDIVVIAERRIDKPGSAGDSGGRIP